MLRQQLLFRQPFVMGGIFTKSVNVSVTAKSTTDTASRLWTIAVDGPQPVKAENHVSGDTMKASFPNLHLGHHTILFTIGNATGTFSGTITFAEPVGSGVVVDFTNVGGSHGGFQQDFQVMPLGFVLIPGHGVGIIRGRGRAGMAHP